ncbi:MAG: prolyl oligopeptidase family serine peptidase [Bradymonadia bacterium]
MAPIHPPRGEHVESRGPLQIADPFRPLESLEAAGPWIDHQNHLTDQWLEAHPRSGMAVRLEELMAIGTLGGVSATGEGDARRLFFAMRSGDQEQPVLYVERAGEAPQAIVDPNVLSLDGRTALDWYFPSRDGRLLAYGTSREGNEISTLRVLDIDTGAHLPDEIPFTRAASLAWTPDNTGFYYTRFPNEEAYDRAVYHHTLGADPADDPLIAGKTQLPARTDWPGAVLSEDGSVLVVVRFVNWQKATLEILDLSSDTWRSVDPDGEGTFSGLQVVDGRIFVVSTYGACNGTLVSIDPQHPERADWKVVLPESEAPLKAASLTRWGIVSVHAEDALSRLRRWDRSGKLLGEVTLPAVGAINELWAHPSRDSAWLMFQSYFVPPALMHLGADGVLTTHRAVESDVDTSAFTVTELPFTSYDGTRVPMRVIHRKGIDLDGTHPTILYGYGGFNMSLTPSFSRNVIYWLEQGGVYAVAHLRGGGERGEAWHQGGMKANKFQVFEDFEFAMRALHREGYSRPDRLAIMGGSNGGLLVGALITRAPHLFAGAVGQVGLYDMVRFHTFPPGALWVDEYGCADDPEQAGYIWAYSPYHQVVSGVRYPAVMCTTAEQDTRVHWAHTAKFVAALQEAQAAEAPILMRFRRAVGHGAGKSRSDTVREQVEVYAFLHGVLDADSGA